MKIKDYVVVSHHVLSRFLEIVNERIDEGYIPQGGMDYGNGSYYQAMIKYDDSELFDLLQENREEVQSEDYHL